MSKTLSPFAFHPSHGLAAFTVPRPRPWRPDWIAVETEMTRAFGVIRDCARIAWWDGSALGLHLNGVLGLFEDLDGVAGSEDRP